MGKRPSPQRERLLPRRKRRGYGKIPQTLEGPFNEPNVITEKAKGEGVPNPGGRSPSEPTDRASVEIKYKDVGSLTASLPAGQKGLKTGIALAVVVLAAACFLVPLAAVVENAMTWIVVANVALMLVAAVSLSWILHHMSSN